MVRGTWVLRPSAGLVVEALDDELVVLQPTTGDLHHLDPMATAVWNLLDGTQSVDDVVAALAERAQPTARLPGDVRHLLAHLLESDLIEVLP